MALRRATVLKTHLRCLNYPDIPKDDDALLRMFFAGGDATRDDLLVWLFVLIDQDTKARLEGATNSGQLHQALIHCLTASGYRNVDDNALFVRGISSNKEQYSVWEFLMDTAKYCSEKPFLTTISNDTSGRTPSHLHVADVSTVQRCDSRPSVTSVSGMFAPNVASTPMPSTSTKRRQDSSASRGHPKLPVASQCPAVQLKATGTSPRSSLQEMEKKVHALKKEIEEKKAVLSSFVPVALPASDRAKKLCEEMNKHSTSLTELRDCLERTVAQIPDLPKRESTTTDTLIQEAAAMSREVLTFLGAAQKAGKLIAELPGHLQQTAEQIEMCEPYLPVYLGD